MMSYLNNRKRLTKPATIRGIEKLLKASKNLTHHKDYIVMGSLSIIPLVQYQEVPDAMLMSADVDLCPTLDPERGSEIRDAFGEEYASLKDFDGLFADFARPSWASLPDGFEDRYVIVKFKPSIVARFLEPNDCAVSKLVRGEQRDIEWIISGIKSNILSLEIMKGRLRTVTNFINQEEHDIAKELLEDIENHIFNNGKIPDPIKTQADEFGFSRKIRKRKP